MRPTNPFRPRGYALPLTLTLLATAVASPGCKKIEELMGKGEEAPAETADTPAGDAKAEEKAEEKVAEATPEAIPVEPIAVGLDLMLSFVPDDKAQFVIVRDLSVVPEYYEEANRFLDGPMAKLEADPMAAEGDLKELRDNYAEFKTKGEAFIKALNESGIDLKQGGALIETADNKSLIVFASADPQAAPKLIEALDPSATKKPAECKALDGHEGWAVCADDKATLDAYKPATDPGPVKTALGTKLPGVNLDEANMILNVTEGDTPVHGAVTTLPGQVHAAIALPKNKDTEELFTMLAPGEAKTLADMQPGAGFVWGRSKPELLAKFVAEEMQGAPPEMVKLVEAMTGEWALAGSVDPAGLMFKAGLSDAAAFAPLMALAMNFKEMVPKEIPEMPEAKLTFEKSALQDAGTTTDALHFAVAGIPETDALKGFTGIHADAWAFASGSSLTFAIGPAPENAGKLLSKGDGTGPSDAALAALPPQFGQALKAGTVSFAMHFPTDFLQGVHLKKLVEAALKASPQVKPDQLWAMTSLAAPFSSATTWIDQPAGAEAPIVHISVQAIGNRATDEGKEALDAAHTVADGGDPAAVFGALATKYASSPMKYAYVTRAGTEGPGSMVGSGIGAIAAAVAVAAPVAMGARSATLADDLGVKADTPDPVVEIKTVPEPPKFEPKPVEPDPPKKPKPKPQPKPEEPKEDPPKPDPKKDVPLPVEPEKPKTDPKKPPVPKPTVDPDKPKPTPRQPPRRPPARPG